MAGINPIDDESDRDWDAADAELFVALSRVKIPEGARQRALERLRNESRSDADSATKEALVSTMDGLVVRATAHDESEARESAARESVSVSSASAVYAGAVQPAKCTNGNPPPRASMVRRTALRLSMVAAALAACVLFYVRTLPLPQRELTNYCTGFLEQLMIEPATWEMEMPESSQRLRPLNANVNQDLLPMGAIAIDGQGIADSCTLYKFSTRAGKVVYVFDFRAPRTVAGLNPQLQVLSQSSSGWSIAAVQLPDQLLVVATEGDLGRFFRAMPLA